MLNVRRGIFETNSSSSHSIVIMKEPFEQDDSAHAGTASSMRTYFSNATGRLDLMNACFNRRFEVLTEWTDRFIYLLAVLKTTGREEEMDRMCDYVQKVHPEIKEIVEDFNKNGGFGLPDDYFIDGESHGLLDEMLADQKMTMEEFIFNPRILIIIDSDEDFKTGYLSHVGLLNLNNIEKGYNHFYNGNPFEGKVSVPND